MEIAGCAHKLNWLCHTFEFRKIASSGNEANHRPSLMRHMFKPWGLNPATLHHFGTARLTEKQDALTFPTPTLSPLASTNPCWKFEKPLVEPCRRQT